MHALVTGATGFVGQRLVGRLERPTVLSRDPSRAAETLGSFGARAFAWDAQTAPPREALGGVDCVYHLAGENVGEGRWTAARKQRIRDSRITGTRRLVDGLAALDRRPRVLVSASAIGYYGSAGDAELDESSPRGRDFLADVCVGWEQEAARARELGIRVVNVRIGVVLGRGGGALAKMLPLFRLGLGGRLGNGRQWMSWVHLDDVVGLLLHAAERDEISGPMNAVAPAPLTNRQFTRALARAVRRPAYFPAPAFMLRLAIGEFAEVLLGSQRVVPRVAQGTRYEYVHPDIDEALREIVSS